MAGNLTGNNSAVRDSSIVRNRKLSARAIWNACAAPDRSRKARVANIKRGDRPTSKFATSCDCVATAASARRVISAIATCVSGAMTVSVFVMIAANVTGSSAT